MRKKLRFEPVTAPSVYLYLCTFNSCRGLFHHADPFPPPITRLGGKHTTESIKNPCMQEENMQTHHRSVQAGIRPVGSQWHSVVGPVNLNVKEILEGCVTNDSTWAAKSYTWFSYDLLIHIKDWIEHGRQGNALTEWVYFLSAGCFASCYISIFDLRHQNLFFSVQNNTKFKD